MLLVGKGKVVPCGTLAALLGAKGRIREHQIEIVEGLARIGQGVAQQNLAVDAMQHGIHQGQTVGIMTSSQPVKASSFSNLASSALRS